MTVPAASRAEIPARETVGTPRRRILHVLAPARFGGLESVVRAIAIGQRRRGHDVSVALLLGHGASTTDWTRALGAAGVTVIPIVLPGRRYVQQYRAVTTLCRRLHPDVVHTHGYHADVVAAHAARRAGVPTVTTVHGFTGGGRKNRLYEWLQRATLGRFDGVIAVSRAMASDLRARVDAAHLHVIPNFVVPIAKPLTASEARERLGVGDGTVLGWIGRLSAEKGPDVALRALALLPDSVRLSVLGDGPEREALQRLAVDLGVAERVRWHGAVEDAAALIPAFDAVVISSRREGMPIVLLEAMAAGVPVVATRVGGIPEVVTSDEAALVDGDDPAPLAAAIAATLGDPATAGARADAARRRIATDFTVDVALDRLDGVYSQVSAGGRRSR